MANNEELIKALRYCADEKNICTAIKSCGYYRKAFFCQNALLNDAADALEAAEKRIEGLQELVDMNTERCESLRKQLREAHECYEKHINELEARLPTIDAAEVVHCKDCKWWDKVDNIDGVNYGTCERKCTAIRKDAFPNENWFCADGEVKNNE